MKECSPPGPNQRNDCRVSVDGRLSLVTLFAVQHAGCLCLPLARPASNLPGIAFLRQLTEHQHHHKTSNEQSRQSSNHRSKVRGFYTTSAQRAREPRWPACIRHDFSCLGVGGKLPPRGLNVVVGELGNVLCMSMRHARCPLGKA